MFRSYFPDSGAGGTLTTEDLGWIDADGRLTIVGRRDAVIITGGKKVFPIEVEAALRASGLFSDVAVVGVADAEWGQRVVACYPAAQAMPDGTVLNAAMAGFAPHQRPKAFIAVTEWPRNEQGKVNRAALLRAAFGETAG
jgi:O-succinylbenzoic acid--CoA ligase